MARFQLNDMLKERGDSDIKQFLAANDDASAPGAKMAARRRKPDTLIERVIRLMRQGLRVGASMSGQNMTNFDDKEKRVLSPRFVEKINNFYSCRLPLSFSLASPLIAKKTRR